MIVPPLAMALPTADPKTNGIDKQKAASRLQMKKKCHRRA
jgi:hypothetical protein